MAKITTKTTKTAVAAKSNTSEKTYKSDEDKLAELKPFEYQMVEITGGKKFPIGKQFPVVKIGVHNRFHYQYLVLETADGTETCDPKFAKIVKALTPAKAAAAKASQDAAREATLLLSGIVKNESERAVLIKHHAWYRPCWFPKTLISVVGEHEDGIQTIYEVPTWKVNSDHGPEGVRKLEELQDAFQAMIEPEPVKPVKAKPSTKVMTLVGPKVTTQAAAIAEAMEAAPVVIKKTSAAAKSIRRTGK